MERSTSDDFHSDPHRLSLCGNIISFNCLQNSSRNRESSELTYHCVSFVRKDKSFQKVEGSSVIKEHMSCHVNIVSCSCVFDIQKRIRAPYVLISRKSTTKDKYYYYLYTLNNANKLESCISFIFPYQIKDKVHIFHGPTVVWSHKNDVHFVTVKSECVERIAIQMSHSLFGELPNQKRKVFVIGQKTNSSHPSQIQSIGTSTFGYFVDDGQVFDGTQFFPRPYVAVIKCFLVLKADVVDEVPSCTVVAATSNQQLVYFEKGILKDMCQLPFEHAEHIQVAYTGRNGCLFVIFFQQGKVCSVWKETFEVASCWSDVSSVHVDDFMRCGTDQILLAFKNREKTEMLKNFLITDLCGISFSSGQVCEASERSPPLPENYILTLTALESRLQSGLIVLQELQREVDVKDKVLQKSVQILTDLSERKTGLTQPEQEGLFALWDSDDVPKKKSLDEKIQESPLASSKPQIDKFWHRITEDRMVVGVMLTSDSTEPVASVSLSLLTATHQSSTPGVIQTQSKVFRFPASTLSTPSSSSSLASMFAEPEAKRSKQGIISNDLNTGSLAVTAVTKLAPLLNSGCVKYHVMLHYVQKADAFSLARQTTPVVVHCGELTVDIHDVFQTQMLKNPQSITDEVREDFLSLLALLDCWVFHIDSPAYTLGGLEDWILKRDGCKKVEVSPQHLLLNSSGQSAVFMRWHQISPFQGELSIHSSQLQMLQFLDLLCEHLPSSCSIRPVKGTTCQKTAQGFASVLEKEMKSLRECLSSLLCEEHEEKSNEECTRYEETPETSSKEGLQRCREVWQQDMERSKTRLSPLVDLGQYRKLLQNICEVQMDGDLHNILKN